MMTSKFTESGQASALMMVGLVVLAIPAGLSLAHGLIPTSTPMTTDAAVSPTLPPVHLTDTPTPTSTPKPGNDGNENGGDTNNTEGDTKTGQTLVVDAGSGVSDGIQTQSESSCSNPNYATIQRAVNAANPGDTVLVCEGTYVESVTIPRGKTNLTITANGFVTVVGLGQPALQSNASGVTIRGFDIRARQGADHAIVIGGKDTLIANNTVTSQNGTGIFLSDGYTNQGENDPELGAATGSLIVNNTVSAYDYRIWADAGRALIRNNNVTDLLGDHDPERRVCDGRECEGANHSIVSSGNKTVIQNNTVRYNNHAPTLWTALGSGILIGLNAEPGNPDSQGKAPGQGAWHDVANHNLVIGNSVSNAPGNDFGGIGLLQVATGTVVRNNVLTGNLVGIRMFSNETVIRNNTIHRLGYGVPLEGIIVEGEARITGNTISLYGTGIQVRGTAVITNNTIQDNLYNGILVEYYDDHYMKVQSSARIFNNEITDNEVGIRFEGCVDCGRDSSAKQYQIHRNQILNNSDFGILNENKSYIVDATNNIWACGGPSSGANPLADPYTGRLANGSGDAISGGNGSTRNGHPMSNVHFDPFQELSSCREAVPTHTGTPTPTPTKTPTQTLTATPTPTPPPGIVNGTDGVDGNNTGGDGSSGETKGGNGSSDRKITPPLTSKPTETPEDTPTISPTPRVEPGFGIGTWVLGVAILISLVALRRRTGPDANENHD